MGMGEGGTERPIVVSRPLMSGHLKIASAPIKNGSLDGKG